MGAIVGDALAQRLSAPIGAFVFDAARNVQLASFGLLIGGTTAHYWCDAAPHVSASNPPLVSCTATDTSATTLSLCGLDVSLVSVGLGCMLLGISNTDA